MPRLRGGMGGNEMIVTKCPCCGSEKERPPYYAHEVTWSCSSCFFQCRNEDLPLVAAAMDLARASKEYDNSNLHKIMGAGARLNAAFERVLEVFNAK